MTQRGCSVSRLTGRPDSRFSACGLTLKIMLSKPIEIPPEAAKALSAICERFFRTGGGAVKADGVAAMRLQATLFRQAVAG